MAEKAIKLPVVNLAGKKVGTVELASAIFGIKDENAQVIHDAVVCEQANKRQATAKTKKRSEVRGGGKKPWRQKGTGRARAGSTRSPIWVGGGVAMGPDGNQNYKLIQNKKAHKLALKTAYSQVAAEGLIVVDAYDLKEISTKAFVKDLTNIKAEGKTLVIVGTDEESENLVKSARNIEKVVVRQANNVSVMDLLHNDTVIVTESTIKAIEGGLN